MVSRFTRELQSAVGPLTRQQLEARGVSRSALRGARWRTTTRGLFVPSDIPLTSAQRILEAVPLVPTMGALTGWAAAYVRGVDYLDGIDPFTLQPLAVLVALNTASVGGT